MLKIINCEILNYLAQSYQSSCEILSFYQEFEIITTKVSKRVWRNAQPYLKQPWNEINFQIFTILFCK